MNVPYSRKERFMSTPKGVSCYTLHLANDDHVFIYHSAEYIVLQLRRKVPTEKDILQPSMKFAVPLQPEEALSLAAELLTIAQVAERKHDGPSLAQKGQSKAKVS
jgi:hypothetical protein